MVTLFFYLVAHANHLQIVACIPTLNGWDLHGSFTSLVFKLRECNAPVSYRIGFGDGSVAWGKSRKEHQQLRYEITASDLL